MHDDVKQRIDRCDTANWKPLRVPFGDEELEITVPPECVSLHMEQTTDAVLSRADIEEALLNPIGSLPIGDLIAEKPKPIEELTVCITVSDITRPIPYKGENGALTALLRLVEKAGVIRENIVILIGNGMHRPSTPEERVFMYGQDVVDQYRIVDHDCENLNDQVLAARTTRGTEVHLNKLFFDADVRIVTGLVESHFMAGASGGRKGVCPALVNTHTLENFHGVDFLEHENATNLILDGNPCHEEALEVALAVGVDFLVNVTLDHQLQLIGVYAGDIEAAHRKAVEAIKSYVAIPIEEPFDIVLTHGAYVGRNHYQGAKAAVGAMPAIKDDGMIVMVSNTFDEEPVGGVEYRALLHLLKTLGPDGFITTLKHPDWVFTKDQWQPQMWAKPLRKTGEDGLVYCAPQLSLEDEKIIPGITGSMLLPQDATHASEKERAQAMLQNAVKFAVSNPTWNSRKPSMAFVAEGPYAIPMLKS